MKWCESISIVVSVIFSMNNVQAQEITWAEHIAPLIYENCSSCHHQDAIAPFTLMNYIDVFAFADVIHHSVEDREMPPWPADPDYMHFVDEAYLDSSEIQMIVDWIYNDMPYGDESLEPDPPVFPPKGSLLDQIDIALAIPPYTLQYDVDELRWFSFENTSEDTLFIEGMEVMPGLESAVHHADLYIDFTEETLMLDALDTLSGFNSDTGFPNFGSYLNAWQPGANILSYPENWAFIVPPGAHFYAEIHYGPRNIGNIDSTVFHIQLLNATGKKRGLKAAWLMNHGSHLVDGPLTIEANTLDTFHQETAPLPNDISVVAICPHMHLIGKSYKVWYETIQGDSFNLINIPRWDFHWQKYYAYQQILKIPAGSILKSEAVYDNTLDNHDNPNNPPQTVSLGLDTEDEMMLCYFIYTDFEAGDEDIVMDSLLFSNIKEIPKGMDKKLSLSPNPSSDFIQVRLEGAEILGLKVFNSESRLCMEKRNPELKEDIKLTVSSLNPGVYILIAQTKDESFVQKFIKH